MELVGTHAIGTAAGCLLGTLEDSGVGLSDLVLASAGDHGTLDTEGSSVATGITSSDGDLAVGGNEGRGRESEDEDLGEHFGWFGLWRWRVCFVDDLVRIMYVKSRVNRELFCKPGRR